MLDEDDRGPPPYEPREPDLLIVVLVLLGVVLLIAVYAFMTGQLQL